MPSIECLIGQLQSDVKALKAANEKLVEEIASLNEKLDAMTLTHAKDETKHAVERGLALWIGRAILTALAGGLAWAAMHFGEWAISASGPFNRH